MLFTRAVGVFAALIDDEQKAVTELGVLQTLLGGLERIRHGEQHGFFRFAGGIVIIEADDGVAVVVRLKGNARAAVVIGREILRAHPLHFTVVVHAGAQCAVGVIKRDAALTAVCECGFERSFACAFFPFYSAAGELAVHLAGKSIENAAGADMYGFAGSEIAAARFIKGIVKRRQRIESGVAHGVDLTVHKACAERSGVMFRHLNDLSAGNVPVSRLFR